MANVKWIKVTTDIFDDEKILLIESLPHGSSILLVWFKLLCLAGKMNNDGVFLLNGKIAYTAKMLATIFRMDEKTVQLALKTFEDFGMTETTDGVVSIKNWNKHQSLDTYDKKKQRDKSYQAERRLNQRIIIAESTHGETINRHSKDDSETINRHLSDDFKTINRHQKDDAETINCHEVDDSETIKSLPVAVSEEEEEIEEDIEYKKKKIKEKETPLFDRFVGDYFLSQPLEEKMREWVMYKFERHEVYKEQGLKALLRQVETNAQQFGDEAMCRLIDESMANNWKGIIFNRLREQPPGRAQKPQNDRLGWIDGVVLK